MFSPPSARFIRGCATSLLMAPTKATSCATLWPNSAAGQSTSSNDRGARRALWCCPAGGWWSAPSPGLAAAAGWPRTSRRASKAVSHGFSSLTSACSPAGSQSLDPLLAISSQTLSRARHGGGPCLPPSDRRRATHRHIFVGGRQEDYESWRALPRASLIGRRDSLTHHFSSLLVGVGNLRLNQD